MSFVTATGLWKAGASLSAYLSSSCGHYGAELFSSVSCARYHHLRLRGSLLEGQVSSAYSAIGAKLANGWKLSDLQRYRSSCDFATSSIREAQVCWTIDYNRFVCYALAKGYLANVCYRLRDDPVLLLHLWLGSRARAVGEGLGSYHTHWWYIDDRWVSSSILECT
jgi:hypothetical protein